VRTRLALAGIAILALAAAAGLAMAAAGGGTPASASAIAVLVKLPDGTSSSSASITAPPARSVGIAGAGGIDPGVVTIASGTSSVSTGPGSTPRAEARVQLSGVSLFGGEVQLGSVAVVATATAGGGGTSGDLSHSSVDGLTVLGQALPAGVNQQISLGFGHAVVLEQGVQQEGSDYRGLVTAIHVYLDQAHAGLPAGSEILVGYAEAAVHGGSGQPAGTAPGGGGQADTSTETEAGGGGGGAGAGQPAHTPQEPEPSPPGATGGPPPIVRNPPPGVRPQITGAGYVFPVYGYSSFGNDFAAPRADTIWHHGIDIFAKKGTPVLAVASGTLSLVGWNTLGGHRLWLTDSQGNQYYYAHLSAYSPLAVNGASVQAGDVLGFVGDSGASGGVFHLHFEIHPRALLGLGYDGVVNPYEYLSAWEEQRDEALDFGGTVGIAPAPGAVLLGGKDISTASGLDPEAVRRALALPVLGEGSPLALRTPRPLVGAPPGF
jgi:murein DD-endopeptidase MepM/ murein hydrolase activator NlpD